MKFFLSVILIILAAVAGYHYEPQLREALTGIKPGTALPAPAPVAEAPSAPAAPAPLPEPAPLPATPESAPEPPAPAPELASEPAAPTPPAGDSAPIIPEIPSPDAFPPPAPAPAEETANSPTILAMQESVKKGEVTEFTFKNVSKWTDGPEEALEGETYQTGFADCEIVTNFGSSQMRAKAYIFNGKVDRWVWPKTNSPIK
ncbi:MAG: hypothetical protein QM680_09745 [Luteolibacter sp.]